MGVLGEGIPVVEDLVVEGLVVEGLVMEALVPEDLVLEKFVVMHEFGLVMVVSDLVVELQGHRKRRPQKKYP
jgi:hypothetical protein